MTDAHLAALSALAGAVIGSLGGAFASFLAYRQSRATQRAEDRRHLMQLELELGLKEWELQSAHGLKVGGKVFPPQVYAYFSARFIEWSRMGN
jgi:hypothetical protein